MTIFAKRRTAGVYFFLTSIGKKGDFHCKEKGVLVAFFSCLFSGRKEGRCSSKLQKVPSEESRKGAV